MRPPQNAGEDRLGAAALARKDGSFNEAPAERGGRLGRDPRLDVLHRDASMRPPQNAGEDFGWRLLGGVSAAASMRPPQNAGEDSSRTSTKPATRCCFNEAPAERGGRLHRRQGAHLRCRRASMRPPQNAGEDSQRHGDISRSQVGLQ